MIAETQSPGATEASAIQGDGRRVRALFATGTPGGEWAAQADELCEAIGGRRDADAVLASWLAEAPDRRGALADLLDDGERGLPVLRDDRLPACLADAVGQVPGSRCLIFVDAPAHLLARRLEAGEPFDAVAELAHWRAGAAALLRQVQAQPEACLVVLHEEALRRPAALRERVAREFGVAFERAPRLAAGGAIDALALAVARGLVDEEAEWLHAELVVASADLGSPAAPAFAALALDRMAAAATGYRRGREAVQAERRWQEERSDLLEQLREAQQDAARAARIAQDNDALRRQSTQVLDELEFVHAQLRRERDRDPVASPALSAAAAPLRRASVGEARLTEPHLELNLHVEHAATAGHAALSFDARLVQHHGRPGLVIFDDPEGGPLARPATDGTENGRAFTIIVPSDSSRMERLSASDWSAVLGVGRIGHAALSGLPSQAFWWSVAARFLQQMDESAATFRHDGVKLAAIETAAGGRCVEVNFDNALCAGLNVPALTLRWSVSGGADVLELVRANTALLPSWPCEVGGAALAVWRLPVGGSQAAGQAGLSAAERVFVIGLVGALARLPADAVGAAGADWVAGRATVLARKVRTQLGEPRWRRALRALRDAVRGG
ncbi:MAG: hypothetical protein ABJD97_01255 [Betaproteobacteria bacterium]